VKAFLPVISGDMGIREVYGICLKANAASCRVLAKCGFRMLFDGMGPYQGEEKEIIRSVWNA
jgi:RimJ/RimL family protein N-acetyltransferase